MSRGGVGKNGAGQRGTEAQAPAAARRRWKLVRALAWPVVIVAAALGAFLFAKHQAQGGSEQVAPPARGLPHTPDYHALVADPENGNRLLLGTHAGVYTTRDGGVTWLAGPLGGEDVINLEHAPDGTLWAAGHFVLERSTDGGITWDAVNPSGLPDLDIHGFATTERMVYAAIEDKGLYVSMDDGLSFRRVSSEVGGSVYGLEAHGRDVLAADPTRGVLRSDDGGSTWRVVLAEPVVGLAASPTDPQTVLASGRKLWRSTDGGRTWAVVFEPTHSVGPATWASNAVAFAIVFETRSLYQSADGGATWAPVVSGDPASG